MGSKLFHDSRNVYYRSPKGAVATDSTVRLAIDVVDKNIEIDTIKIHTWQTQSGTICKQMEPSSWDKNHYIIDLTMPSEGCVCWYYFVIHTVDGNLFYYGNNVKQLGGVGEETNQEPKAFQITIFKRDAKTPDWFKKSVMYQIFPDRFYRSGNEIIHKDHALLHCDWDEPPMYCKDPDTHEIIYYDYFGGNIQGVKEKLSYLKDLGINVIYFNPIFKSRGNHHYDTADYYEVDPLFGTNEEFAELCKMADELGIKIILDGVFSHTGSDSIYFNKYGKFDSVGAYQSKDSPYYEWYDFKQYPTQYDCWWNFDTMPNVKEMTPSYMDFIINDEDSVLNHWMNKGIIGWRMDVIDELPREFSRAFYRKLKSINPDAVMIGEVWEDASNKVSYGVDREYLCGYELDSAMNYPLRQIMLDFLLGKDTAAQICTRIASQQENYPAQNLYAMMNLLGSHDVERVLTLLGEAPSCENVPTSKQAKFKLDTAHLKLAKQRLKVAIAWQMTMPGVPSIYYGDEVGAQGYRDPYNRGTFPWSHIDEDLHAYTKKLIALRQKLPALQTGYYEPIYAQGDVLAYFRTSKLHEDKFADELDACILIALNRNSKTEQMITVNTHGFCNGKLQAINSAEILQIIDNQVQIKLAPLEAKIFKPVAETKTYARCAGVLLHPTSLPSPYGIGDLGDEAYKFIDWLKLAGQKLWQVLPLNPVGYGASPYQSPSAFAGNTTLISPEKLVEMNLLTKKDIALDYKDEGEQVDFVKVQAYKEKILHKAFANFTADKAYEEFCEANKYWLEDYALFVALKKFYKDKSWTKWEKPIKLRRPQALAACRESLADDIAYVKFTQYIFDLQWKHLHDYAKTNGIQIIGDVPIFPSHDSADVWTHQDQFNLNPDGSLKTSAGVPPDYFSADGQLWGNPHYLWDKMEEDDYTWWRQRFTTLLKFVDIIRLDHFRGFEAYWAVPGDAKTARIGKWIKGPDYKFFTTIKKYLGDIPIIAEDLGVITPEVEKLKNACGFPGMKVLQFELYPNNFNELNVKNPTNSIVYTGTHDNNTTLGWLKTDVNPMHKAIIADLLKADVDDDEQMLISLMNLAYVCDSKIAVLPMQDILHLDGKARMNLPGTVGTNWGWRMKAGSLTKTRAENLKNLVAKYNR